MQCSNCGTVFDDGAIQCPVCGAAAAPAAPAPDAQAQTPQQPGAYTMPPEPAEAGSAKIFGIIALILSALTGIGGAGLTLGIVALVFSLQSKKASGGAFTPSSKTGFVCGLIAVIISALQVLAVALMIVFMFVFAVLWELPDGMLSL